MDVLKQIKQLIRKEDKRIIRSSAMEGAWSLGLSTADIIRCTLKLTETDYVGKRKLSSQEASKETGYVFKALWEGKSLYIKFKLFAGCLYILSFKESTDE